MEIVCQKCSAKFNIPDQKVPTDRSVSLPCPKCKNKLTIGPRTESADSVFADMASSNYDASDKPFDFIEEEGQTALVCESDPTDIKKIVNNLNILEYHVTVTDSGRDALKKMRYHQYDLIVVNESFSCEGPDSNMVLMYLERLNMIVRRNIFVVMLSSRFRTMDQMMAFRYSVNIVVNTKNVDDIEKVIQRGLTDNEFFYRIYNETLKEVGKA